MTAAADVACCSRERERRFAAEVDTEAVRRASAAEPSGHLSPERLVA